ncbi:hypothetical protein [Pedobacter mendelii]|uniref:hypothetical protein n=1 Tax=Pedobacter mendelii TaxID=1908240 RepID=UPI00166D3F6F|nr:hypothetical protein [Pedobacter mendelii]
MIKENVKYMMEMGDRFCLNWGHDCDRDVCFLLGKQLKWGLGFSSPFSVSIFLNLSAFKKDFHSNRV